MTNVYVCNENRARQNYLLTQNCYFLMTEREKDVSLSQEGLFNQQNDDFILKGSFAAFLYSSRNSSVHR